MVDANAIRTLGDYSKPSHEGYRNTIELIVGNNVVPFRSDTIRLVQNGCSFLEVWSEDLNQHLTDFLKLMDSLDLDDPEQAFVEYASSCADEAGGDDGDVMFIEIVKKDEDSRKVEPEAGRLEDISSIIDHRLSQVVLGKPFVDISNMTHEPPNGVVRFTNRTDEMAYKMPHKIEQYNSLSDLEKSTRNRSTLRARMIREEEWMAGDGATSIKRRHRDPSSDGVRIMVTSSGCGRLKDDLESSMWRQC
nr:MAK10-like protein [Tanacetum cinerariifolium]GEZ08987.1 MAK10-like protein [Tanacetum cinerariifolium]